MSFLGHFMIVMMSALLVMQLFWTYYLIRSFLAVSVTDKVSHTYSEITNIKKEDKKEK